MVHVDGNHAQHALDNSMYTGESEKQILCQSCKCFKQTDMRTNAQDR